MHFLTRGRTARERSGVRISRRSISGDPATDGFDG
jgi:hypothetical protein